jgi:hypothetical protein
MGAAAAAKRRRCKGLDQELEMKPTGAQAERVKRAEQQAQAARERAGGGLLRGAAAHAPPSALDTTTPGKAEASNARTQPGAGRAASLPGEQALRLCSPPAYSFAQ